MRMTLVLLKFLEINNGRNLAALKISQQITTWRMSTIQGTVLIISIKFIWPYIKNKYMYSADYFLLGQFIETSNPLRKYIIMLVRIFFYGNEHLHIKHKNNSHLAP